MTAEALAEHFEVSTRTIRRDVDALSAAGIPVYAARGRGGGVRLLPEFVLSKTLLTAREQDEILFALQSLQAVGVNEAKSILPRLSGLFRRAQVDWIDVDFSCWGSGAPEREKYQLLKDAILDRRLLSFGYFGQRGVRTERTVEPYHLNFKSGAWYLQGWCRERQGYRTFKITRMEGLCLQDERFAPRPEPLPTMDDPGDTLPVMHVVVRFTPRAAFRVFDEFHRSCIEKQPDGSFIVAVDWPADDWGCGYLLSFGADAEVLAPPALRTRMEKETEKILNKYRK